MTPLTLIQLRRLSPGIKLALISLQKTRQLHNLGEIGGELYFFDLEKLESGLEKKGPQQETNFTKFTFWTIFIKKKKIE